MSSSVRIIVLVGTLLLTACSAFDGGGHDDDSAVAGSPVCPDTESSVPYPDSGILRAGANAVRLCALYRSSWTGPSDVLTTDVVALIADINGRPAQGGAAMCLSHKFDTYALVFSYPDGTSHTVVGDLSRCDDSLHTGEVVRQGAVEVRQAFLARLVSQRRELSPPAAPAQATCPQTHEGAKDSLVPLDADTELVDAVVCSYQWTSHGNHGWNNQLTHAAPLQPALLGELNRAVHTSLRPITTDWGIGNHLLAISAKTAWGDDVTFVLTQGELIATSPRRLDDSEYLLAFTPRAPLTESLRWQP